MTSKKMFKCHILLFTHRMSRHVFMFKYSIMSFCSHIACLFVHKHMSARDIPISSWEARCYDLPLAQHARHGRIECAHPLQMVPPMIHRRFHVYRILLRAHTRKMDGQKRFGGLETRPVRLQFYARRST